MTVIKKFTQSAVAAALLALVATGSWALNTNVANQPFVNNAAQFEDPYANGSFLTGEFAHFLTLTGLSPGTYDFSFSLSGQYINPAYVTFDGVAADTSYFGPAGKYLFSWLDRTTSANPIQIQIFGVATSTQANYSGEVSAVPEPAALALALASLGVLVWVRRQRKA